MKLQQLKAEVKEFVTGFARTSIREWHSARNFVDNHGCDGYIFQSEQAAMRYVLGNVQWFTDAVDGACPDEEWVSILTGATGSRRRAKRIVKDGRWDLVVRIMARSNGPEFFLSTYSGQVHDLSDGQLLYY